MKCINCKLRNKCTIIAHSKVVDCKEFIQEDDE